MPNPDHLGQAIDLSTLGTPQQKQPDYYVCDLCGLRMRNTVAKHQSYQDCLQTTLPYVEMYLELADTSEKLVTGLRRMERNNIALLDANERLLKENDELKGNLRTARRGTPEAARAVLEGAANLAESMKESVQPVQSAVRVQPTSSDARTYLKGMGVPETEVDATPDDGLSDLYEKYSGSH